jgi:hypothetical protein
MHNELIVHNLRKCAEIRQQIQTRKSVQEGKPDRLSELLVIAANRIEELEGTVQDLQDEIRCCGHGDRYDGVFFR